MLLAGWKRCQARRHERFILAAEKSMANHLWRLQEGHEARKTGKSSRMHYITYSFLYHHKPFHTSSCTPLDKYHIDYQALPSDFSRHDPSLTIRFGNFSWLRVCFRVSKSWLTLNRTTTSLRTLRTVKGFSFSSSITETFRLCEKSHSCCPRVSR